VAAAFRFFPRLSNSNSAPAGCFDDCVAAAACFNRCVRRGQCPISQTVVLSALSGANQRRQEKETLKSEIRC
jgi:hypothetical protein